MELSAQDLSDAANFMQSEAETHWRTFYLGVGRNKTLTVAQWCMSHLERHPHLTTEDLQQLAKNDARLKERCGSIWILLLGNLLIQLFMLWLRRRLDK